MSEANISICSKCQGTLTSLGYCYTCKAYPELDNFSFVSDKTTQPETGLHDYFPGTGDGADQNAFSSLAEEKIVMVEKKVGCYDCGLEYGEPEWIEAVISDAIWNEIRPENASEWGGILCITCICRRLKSAGYDDVPCFICGTEPIIVLPEDKYNEYSLRNFITRHWKQKR